MFSKPFGDLAELVFLYWILAYRNFFNQCRSEMVGFDICWKIGGIHVRSMGTEGN